MPAAQNPSNFEDEPSNASTRSLYTKGLAVCQIQDPYEEVVLFVIRRARDIIASNAPRGHLLKSDEREEEPEKQVVLE